MMQPCAWQRSSETANQAHSSLSLAGAKPPIAANRWFRPRLPAKPRFIAETAGSAMSMGVKLGRSARIRAAQAIVSTPSATSGFFGCTTRAAPRQPPGPAQIRSNSREKKVEPVQPAHALPRGLVLGQAKCHTVALTYLQPSLESRTAAAASHGMRTVAPNRAFDPNVHALLLTGSM
jgi:hypothetical protein